MKTRKLFVALIALTLVAAMAGCAPSKPVSSGSFSGNTYTNDFFGMSFTVPDGWNIASKEKMAEIFTVDVSAVGSDDKEAEKKLNLSKQKELYLAFVSQLMEDGTESGVNMNLLAENLSLFGAVVKTGKAYCQAAVDNLKTAYEGMDYTIGDITEAKVNGADFAYMDTTVNGNLDGTDYTYYQRMLCTVKNNYALVYTLTWFDDAGLAELQKIVDSIEFK